MLKKYKISKNVNLHFLKVDPLFNNFVIGLFIKKILINKNKPNYLTILYKIFYLINYLIKYSSVVYFIFYLFKIISVPYYFLIKRLRSSLQKIPLLLTFISSLKFTFKTFTNLVLNVKSTQTSLTVQQFYLKILLFVCNILNKGSLFKKLLTYNKNLVSSKKYLNYRW